MTSIGKLPGDDTLMRHGDDAGHCPPAARRWVLAATIIGSSMAFVDGTVVNVALPTIQRELGATAFQAQWIVESYALFLAALLLVGGAMGDRLGRRKVFLWGVALFAVASVACALSATVQQLIAARAVQGVGAALLVPGSLALISANFPERERGKAIGTWSGFSGITAAIGPVVGGFLVDHFSWTWAFLINVPLAAAVLWIGVRHVPESRGAGARQALDIAGALAATLSLGGVVYAFVEAPVQGWHAAPVWGALVLGVLAGAAFVAVERRSTAPMLPLALFGQRNFSGANLLTLLLYAALGGSLYFIPLNLIQVQGYSATQAGAALLPFIAIMFALSRWAGQLVDRFGPRLPLVVGPSIAAVGFGLFALPGTDATYWSGFLPAVVVLGLGMSITVAPLTTTVLNAVSDDMAGVASGVNNAVSRVAAVLALAVFGLLMAWAFNTALAGALQAMQAPPAVQLFFEGERVRLAAAQLPPDVDPATALALRQAIKASFVSGFRWVMGVSAALALLSAGCAWGMISGSPGRAGRPAR